MGLEMAGLYYKRKIIAVCQDYQMVDGEQREHTDSNWENYLPYYM